MTRSTPIGMIVLATACAACGTGSDESLTTVRDSAGIEIVESRRPQWQEGEAWTLSPEPILEIGVTEGEEPYLLDQVMGAVRFENGTVVVANMGDNTLRYFDGTGEFLHSAGGSGGGPAEFEQIAGLRRLGDSVVAWQYWVHRSKVFDLQGNFVHAMQAPTRPTDIVGVFDDGSHLFGVFVPARPAQTELRLDSTPLFLSTPDFADADSIALFPAAYVVGIELASQRVAYPQEYGPVRVAAVGANDWYYGWPETYEFQVRDQDATVHRIVRRAWEPVPVTDVDRERHRESVLGPGDADPVPPLLAQRRRSIVDAMLYPEHHPAFRRIYPDRSGHVWVELPDPANPKVPGFTAVREVPTTWDVFDPSGAWLGSVELPARLFVFEIGDDYVAGVWKDEFDVERVRVYELVKP